MDYAHWQIDHKISYLQGKSSFRGHPLSGYIILTTSERNVTKTERALKKWVTRALCHKSGFVEITRFFTNSKCLLFTQLWNGTEGPKNAWSENAIINFDILLWVIILKTQQKCENQSCSDIFIISQKLSRLNPCLPQCKLSVQVFRGKVCGRWEIHISVLIVGQPLDAPFGL